MSKARKLADLGNAFDDGALSNRNLIINGAMQVSQRGTSVTGITSTTYGPCDRFRLQLVSMGTWSTEQSSDAPDGFSNSFKVSCTTADGTPASSDFVSLRQLIEAQNLQQLSFGSSSAKSITLSFWVKSNKTGTYVAEFKTIDPNPDRTRDVAYTISASDTWEYKVITVEGDTVGAINNDSGLGMEVTWWLGVGSNFSSGTIPSTWTDNNNPDRAVGQVNLADSTSNYWQITGVQLEVGDTATPFEHRSYGDELQRCSRYAHVLKPEQAYGRYRATYSDIGTSCNTFYEFPVEMRSVPTLISNNMSSSTFQCYSETDAAFRNPTGAFTLGESSKRHVFMACNTATATASAVGMWRWNNNPSASMVFDAEL